jgi:hypothetical protein
MPAEREGEEFRGISKLHVSRLLSLGLSGKREPIDELVDRLRQPDGAPWLRAALARGPLSELGPLEELLAAGSAKLSQMEELKKRSNALLENPAERDAFLSGMACYFFSIAAALVHHRRLITSQTREKLDPVLKKLARAVPEPWAELLKMVSAPPERSP